MKTFVTEYWREDEQGMFGGEVEAETWAEAQEKATREGLGVVVGELVMKIPADGIQPPVLNIQ